MAAAVTAPPLALTLDRDFTSAAIAHEPVNWIFAQAPDTTYTQAPVPANAVVQPEPEGANRWIPGFMRPLFPGSAERPLRLAPIRWRGNAGIEQRFVSSEVGGNRNQTLEFATIDASTYVGQPWLVQLRGSLGFLASQESIGAGALDEADETRRERSLGVTGGAAVSVFPSSRFPFSATFDVSDSRESGDATPSAYTSRRTSLRQSYRSPLGDQTYTGSFQRSVLQSESFGRDSVNSLQATAQHTFGTQIVDMNAEYAQNRRSQSADGSDLGRVSARHSYRRDENTTLESFASFSSTDFMARGEGGLNLRSRFMQINSLATWRPDDESPLFVTGGLRLSDASFGSGGDGDSAGTAGAHVAASYALSRAASVVASASVARISGDKTDDLVTTQAVGATYSPNPIEAAGLSYSWSTSGSLANQTGGLEARQYSLAAQASHQVSRGFVLGPKAGITASVTQGAGLRDDSALDPTRTLQHTGSLSLRAQPGVDSDAFFSVSLGDSRSAGGRQERFQLLNVQASGRLQTGVFSLVTANFTLQGVRQRLDGKQEDRGLLTRSGTMSFQHARVFGVPRLRYLLSATFNDLQLDSRLLGDVTAPHDQYTRLFESRLDYEIGRLDFRIGTRLASFGGKTDRQLFFRVNRQFGF